MQNKALPSISWVWNPPTHLVKIIDDYASGKSFTFALPLL